MAMISINITLCIFLSWCEIINILWINIFTKLYIVIDIKQLWELPINVPPVEHTRHANNL